MGAGNERRQAGLSAAESSVNDVLGMRTKGSKGDQLVSQTDNHSWPCIGC